METLVDCKERRSGSQGMGRDESVERVTRERQVQGALRSRIKLRLVDPNVVARFERLGDPSTGLAQPTNLEQRLQLEHHERREPYVPVLEFLANRGQPSPVSGPQPNGNMGGHVPTGDSSFRRWFSAA